MLAKTKRLGLRLLAVEDAAGLFILNADPEVMRFSDEPRFPSVTSIERYIQQSPHTRADRPAFWAVERCEDGMFLGYCGIKGGNELGFRLFRSQWGKGYATEAALLSLWLGFERFGLDTIIAETRSQNKASVAVLEKLGMVRVAQSVLNDRDPNWHYELTSGSFEQRFFPFEQAPGCLRFTNVVPDPSRDG